MEAQRRNYRFYDNLAEIIDKKVDRVCEKELLNGCRVAVDGIEDGGHIHQQLGENTPQVLNVPKKDKQCRESQTYANVEQHQQTDRVEQKNKLPCENDAVKNTEHEEDAERQAEVDKSLHVLGEQKQVFRYVDLCEDGGVAHEGCHPLRGRFFEVCEHKVATEQVSSIVRHIPAEELGKHQLHDEQHQQRREDTPHHTKYCTLVFLFEVALYQFLEQKLVLQIFLYHKTAFILLSSSLGEWHTVKSGYTPDGEKPKP